MAAPQIIVDGGFCRGTDVIKAIALGADMVCVGRLYASAWQPPAATASRACWSCSRTR
jgi:isopentenyl diphosphate isomerase/L-lactate dehydrogenase-like FMN-dependent dehydrogenase